MDSPPRCACGSDMSTATGHPDHALSCVLLRKETGYIRHNMIRDAIARIFSSLGAYTDARCNGFEFIDGKTLDLALYFADQAMALDVKVVTPACASHVADAQTSLGAAAAGETGKIKKYAGEVNAWEGNLQFLPFVLEAYGAFGECAQDVCRLAGTAAKMLNSGWRTGEATASCVAASAVAMHRGNAIMVRSCYRRAARAESGAGPGRPLGSLDLSPRKSGCGPRPRPRLTS